MTNIEALNTLKRLRSESTSGLIAMGEEQAHRIAALTSRWPQFVVSVDQADLLIIRAERGIAILTANALT